MWSNIFRGLDDKINSKETDKSKEVKPKKNCSKNENIKESEQIE